MKVTLVNLDKSNMNPPLGLVSLATVLEKENYDIKIVDAGKNEKIDYASCDVLGVSFTTVNATEAFRIAKESKQRNIITVAGGPHPTVMPEECQSLFDYVVCGEGEWVFPQLLRDIENGKKRENKVQGVHGDLHSLSTLNFDHVPNLTSYLKHRAEGLYCKKALSWMVTRGCYGSCAYCQPTLRLLFGKGMRMLPSDRIEHDLNLYKSKFGVEGIAFQDDTLTWTPLPWFRKFCGIMKKLDLVWSANCRIDTVNKEKLELMQESNCKLVNFGIESGSEYVRREILKKGNFSNEQITKTFKLCDELGLMPTGYFMLFVPNETKQTLQDTVSFIRTLSPYRIQISIFTPFPGTCAYEQVKDRIRVKDYSQWDYFQRCIYDPSPEFTAEEATRLYHEIKEQITLDVKFNMSYFLKRLRHVHSVKEFTHVFKTGLTLAKKKLH